MNNWDRIKEWLGGVILSIIHETQSRKFRAALFAILGILADYVNPDSLLEPNVALYSIASIVIAYVLGIALEDGLSGREKVGGEG